MADPKPPTTRKAAAQPKRSRDLVTDSKAPAGASGPEVRANTHGFYAGSRRYPGDVFQLEHESHLSDWMDPVDKESAASVSGQAETPESTETGATGDANPLGDE